MKDERMAVLSMLEKGIITAAEAEKLLIVLQSQSKKEDDLTSNLNTAFTKAGEGLGAFAKAAGETMEKVVTEAKPVIKKTIDTVTDKVDSAVEDVKAYKEKKKKTSDLSEDTFFDDSSKNKENSEEASESVEAQENTDFKEIFEQKEVPTEENTEKTE